MGCTIAECDLAVVFCFGDNLYIEAMKVRNSNVQIEQNTS